METPAKMELQVTRGTLRLRGVAVCEKDGVWQCWECWSLCSSSSLVLVPLAVTRGVQEELFARKPWQRKEWRACLWLVGLLLFHYLANSNMILCVIAALVFYSNLIIALFWASEERWEVKVLRKKVTETTSLYHSSFYFCCQKKLLSDLDAFCIKWAGLSLSRRKAIFYRSGL